MRRLLLGVLLLVLLLVGGVSCSSTPTEDIPDKARERPKLLKPGDVKKGPGKPTP